MLVIRNVGGIILDYLYREGDEVVIELDEIITIAADDYEAFKEEYKKLLEKYQI